MGIQIGEVVQIEEIRRGIVFHIDNSLPLPISVGFIDTGEVMSFSGTELIREGVNAVSQIIRSL